MCGLVGLIHPGERKELWATTLRHMTAALIHRGPDEDGFFEENDVSLGFRRLRVMDLDTGSQPIFNEDKSIVVICNGEIYDFENIREKLIRTGHRFQTRSDTEVLVHLYEEYDLNFLQHFDGMFAFALYDRKKNRIVVARDRFGIKPLFYSKLAVSGALCFSSELFSLLKHSHISKELDPLAIDKFMAVSYIPHPYTAYKNVRKLSPGSYLLVENDRVIEQRYWDLPDRIATLPRRAALENLDAAISASVRKMVRADVPVGAFLSGGFDSSTVVSNMAHHLKKPFHTFSIRFDVPYYDEGPQAKDTSAMYGGIHHEIWVKPEDIEKNLSSILTHFGEPYADPSMVPTYLMARRAKEFVTVVLTGDGGDEVYGGYETYTASVYAGLLGKMPRLLRDAFEKVLYAIPMANDYRSWNYKLRKFLAGCHLPPVERHAMWRTGAGVAERAGLYQSDFRNQLGSDIHRPSFDDFSDLFDGASRDLLSSFQYLDIRTYLIDNNLSKVDRMTMAHGLEARIPMLDLGVFKAGFQLPPSLRVRGLETKIALRQIMKPRLPQSVLAMAKKGFGVPLAYWFEGPLKSYLESVLSFERINRTGVLNPVAVQELIKEHLQGRDNRVRQLFNLMCFIIWQEQLVA